MSDAIGRMYPAVGGTIIAASEDHSLQMLILSARDLLTMILRLSYEPGSESRYGFADFIVMTAALEKATGMPFPRSAETRDFRSAGPDQYRFRLCHQRQAGEKDRASAPRHDRAIRDRHPTLTAKLRAVLMRAGDGAPDSASFNAAGSGSLDFLSHFGGALLTAVGPIQAIEPLSDTTVGGETRRSYRIGFEGRDMIWLAKTDSSRRFTELRPGSDDEDIPTGKSNGALQRAHPRQDSRGVPRSLLARANGSIRPPSARLHVQRDNDDHEANGAALVRDIDAEFLVVDQYVSLIDEQIAALSASNIRSRGRTRSVVALHRRGGTPPSIC